MNKWEKIALYCHDTYGVYVNAKEGFFICPKCGEPIYECDWEDEELRTCPVCDFEW